MSTRGESESSGTPRTQLVQQRQRRARRVRIFGIVAALVLLVGGIVSVFALSGDGDSKAAPKPPPASTTTTVPPEKGPAPTAVATTRVANLAVYSAPDAAAKPVVTLPKTTSYGVASTLLVNADEKAPPADWVPVVVPLHKPNGTLGWVQAKDVALTETSFSIQVSLSQHTVTVFNAGAPIFTTPAILGTAATPTPIGRFYVTDPVNCNKENAPGYPVVSCSSVYGAFAIGLSALSEKLDSFSGTIPQIAIHGTNLPDSELGKDLSNGCVRIPSAVVTEIAKAVPLLGVPVIIGA